MYTLKEASKKTNLTEHTIRYYTDQGLVPSLKRDKNNYRLFDDESIEWLQGIKYLRDLGLSIEEIKQYNYLCMSTSPESLVKRNEIINHCISKAEIQLQIAKQRLEYLQHKYLLTKKIINHEIQDSKNPHVKYHNK